MKGQEKQFEKRKAIGQLYGAISGKLSEDKLRLETFVVQNYLEKFLIMLIFTLSINSQITVIALNLPKREITGAWIMD